MRKTALLCQKLTHGSIEGASKLMFILISILRPISNLLALFQLCEYMYNLILLPIAKPFSAQNFTNKVLLTCWQVLGPLRLHHTASHPLTTASSQWFTFAEAEICTKVIARNTLARSPKLVVGRASEMFSRCSQIVPTQTHSPPNVFFVKAAFKRSDMFWKCEKYTEVQWTLTR